MDGHLYILLDTGEPHFRFNAENDSGMAHDQVGIYWVYIYIYIYVYIYIYIYI